MQSRKCAIGKQPKSLPTGVRLTLGMVPGKARASTATMEIIMRELNIDELKSVNGGVIGIVVKWAVRSAARKFGGSKAVATTVAVEIIATPEDAH